MKAASKRARKAAIRSVEERNRLAMTCEKMVWDIAHKWCRTRRRWAEVDDAAAIGFIGLLYAAGQWDESKGIRFTSYAYPAISNAIKQHYEAIRTTGFAYTLAHDDEDGHDEFMSKPAPEAHVSDYDDPAGLAAKLMSRLDTKRRDVIAWRFGIGCFPMPQSEIAKALGVSMSRAQQYEYTAMNTLRRAAGE